MYNVTAKCAEINWAGQRRNGQRGGCDRARRHWVLGHVLSVLQLEQLHVALHVQTTDFCQWYSKL
jgi:hypothetical protein